MDKEELELLLPPKSGEVFSSDGKTSEPHYNLTLTEIYSLINSLTSNVVTDQDLVTLISQSSLSDRFGEAMTLLRELRDKLTEERGEKERQKQSLIKMMEDDEKDGIYPEPPQEEREVKESRFQKRLKEVQSKLNPTPQQDELKVETAVLTSTILGDTREKVVRYVGGDFMKDRLQELWEKEHDLMLREEECYLRENKLIR